MKPQYTVLNLDLAIVRTDTEVLGQGTVYTAVAVLAVPGGAGASMKLGTNSASIPLLLSNVSYELTDMCGNPQCCDEGLFIANPAGAGILSLLVSFADSQIGT